RKARVCIPCATDHKLLIWHRSVEESGWSEGRLRRRRCYATDTVTSKRYPSSPNFPVNGGATPRNRGELQELPRSRDTQSSKSRAKQPEAFVFRLQISELVDNKRSKARCQ